MRLVGKLFVTVVLSPFIAAIGLYFVGGAYASWLAKELKELWEAA